MHASSLAGNRSTNAYSHYHGKSYIFIEPIAIFDAVGHAYDDTLTNPTDSHAYIITNRAGRVLANDDFHKRRM